MATSSLKSTVAQCVASISPSLLLLDLGLALSFPTVAIADMLHSKNDLSLDDTQASWFGSLGYLTQPIGALLSGPVVDYFGRKKATFIVNIPHVVAWILLYLAPDLFSAFIGIILLGFGMGIMEPPAYAYIAEVSEPSLRGTLFLVTQSTYSLGILTCYYLGKVMYWRQVALISLAVPVIAMMISVFIPETPIWLLSNGRPEDAMKSLQSLRGWTTKDKIKEEFDQLTAYSNELKRCVICSNDENTKGTVNQDTTNCRHTRMNPIKRFYLKFKIVMLCKETLRPFIFMVVYFLFLEMTGFTPVRPNMVNFCGAFGMAEDGKNIAFMVGIIIFTTSILVVFFVKLTGKRKMGILSMLGYGLCCLGLSIYAKMYIPDTVYSYDPKTFPQETSYWPLMYFYGLAVMAGCNVPWALLGEIFPFRSRATAQGITTAADYIITFFAAKTLITFEHNFHLSGSFAIYSVFGIMGTLYLYLFMPETEGASLAEIEGYYKGKCRIFADDPFINILKKYRKKT